MIHQLRIYEIFERNKAAFHNRFRDHAAMRSAWTPFMSDEEWKEIKRLTSAQYGDLVGEIEDRLLTLTNYSSSMLQST